VADNYTPDSFKAVSDTLTKAEALRQQTDASQLRIDSVANQLNDAIKALALKRLSITFPPTDHVQVTASVAGQPINSGAQVTPGTKVTFNITVDKGYQATFMINGKVITVDSNNTFTTESIFENITLTSNVTPTVPDSEEARGQADGKADGYALKDHADNSDQSQAYQDAYDKAYAEAFATTIAEKQDTAEGAANGKADGYQRKDAASNIGLSDAYCEAYTKAYNTAKAAADKAAGTEDGTADGKKGIKRDISKESKTYQDAYNSAYAANANPSEPISGTGVINQDHRNDGLYTQVPADGNDTFVGYEMAKQFTQQNVTLLRQVKIGKTTWVQVKLANGTLAWIDKRGLLINGNYDVQVADYDVAIVTAGRNDGLYTSVPTNPGDQFVGFKMAKVYDSQLGHVTETVVINGTKWLHVTIAGQSFWIDSKGTGKVPVTTSNQAAVIDQSKRNDGLYQTIGTVTGTNFKGLVMAKQYDQEKVTIIAEVTVGKTTWARVKLADEQLVWIDKDGLRVIK
jgi:hypothetical protein